MTEKLSNPIINKIWGLSLKETIIASFFGVLTALTKFITRFDMHIPGHTAILWMSLLVICSLWLKKGRAGTMAGCVAGFLAIMLFPGNDGLLTFFKYFLPGLSLDILYSCFPILRQKWFLTSFVAMASLTTKVLVDVVSGLILKIPFNILIWGLRISFLLHAIFGLISGFIGYFLYTRYLVKRNIT